MRRQSAATLRRIGSTVGIPVVAAVFITRRVVDAVADRRRHHVGSATVTASATSAATAATAATATAAAKVGKLGFSVVTAKRPRKLVLEVVVIATNRIGVTSARIKIRRRHPAGIVQSVDRIAVESESDESRMAIGIGASPMQGEYWW